MRTPIDRSLSNRLAGLTQRERVFLFVGAATLLLFLLWLLVWRDTPDEAVELAAAPPPPAIAPPLSVQTVPLPAPAAPIVSAPAIPSPTAASLTLQGVSGGGPGGGAALIQYQGGGQRLVRVGREIVPGMTLRSVGLNWAIASAAGSDLRFDLNRPGAIAVAAASAPTPTPVPASAQAERRETMDLRLGLEPVTSNGRVGGYRVRPGTNLARLGQAGLQPGDLITGVNGSALDEERLLELSWQMSNAERIDLDVVRGGRKTKLSFDARN